MEPRDQEQSVGCHSAEGLSVSVSAQTGGNITAPVFSNTTIFGDLTFQLSAPGASKPTDTHSQNSDLSLKYKELICSEYAYVPEYNSLLGEHVLLADRYTELLIIQRHREQSERETEIRSRGEQFFSARDSEKYSSITVDQFFCPDDHGLIPKAVVLQGNSGNGKSFTAQKIMLDWASSKLYADNFDFIFHLMCKEINQMSGEKSLVELLRYSQTLTPEQISQILQHSPERVLLLIDGFDELKLSQDNVSARSLPTDIQTPASPVSTLKALLSGRLLSESSLLVTTRSTATDTLSKLLNKRPPRFTEIMGFSERGVEEFFQRFFKDDQLLQTQAYELVRANETLFTACSIPVICWIICTVFRERHKDSTELTNGLSTTTSIYVDFVSTLLEHHCQGLSQSVPSLLRSLGQLAERGMLEQQVLFDKKIVSETVPDPISNPFLCKFLFRRTIRHETMFSFMHLSFQEFFTALYYALLNEEKSQSIVRELLQSLDPTQLEQQRNNKLSFLPVIQFLCGLSNEEVNISLMETHNLSVSPNIKEQLKEWIICFCKERERKSPIQRKFAQPSNDMTMKNPILQEENMYLHRYSETFILYCLYELHDEDFVKKAVETWENIDLAGIPLSRTDCWVLQYCLQFCPHIKKLSLMSCRITPEKLKILQPAVSKSEELALMVENLSEDDVGFLVSALGEGKKLSFLGLQHSALSDHGVQQVLSSLNKQRSLGFVSLTVKTITTSTVVMLSEVFQNETAPGYISVQVSEDSVESFCSSLTVSVINGEYRLSVEDNRWMSRFSQFVGPRTEPSLRAIGLTCPHSQISNINWTTFTQIIYGAKIYRENSPEFDEQFDALLSFLNSVPGLKRVELNVNSLTESWAVRILSLLQTCPSLQGISFKAGDDSLSLIEGLRLLQHSQILPDGTLTAEGFKTGEDGADLFFEEQIRLLQHCEEVPDHTLTVEGMGCMKPTEQGTEQSQWTQNCNLNVNLQFCGENFELSVKYNRSLFGFLEISSPQTIPTLSEISFIGPQSERSNINWTKFTEIIYRMKDSRQRCPDSDEQFHALLSFLSSVSGLKKVDLNVSSLTESWASRILSLIQTCPSLQGVSFKAGDDGLLLEEGIRLLQHSQILPDCTLTVEGRRCTKPTDQCTEDKDRQLTCNQTVKLQLHGESFTILD